MTGRLCKNVNSHEGKLRKSGLMFHNSLLVCIHLSVVVYVADSSACADFNQLAAEMFEEVSLHVLEDLTGSQSKHTAHNMVSAS